MGTPQGALLHSLARTGARIGTFQQDRSSWLPESSDAGREGGPCHRWRILSTELTGASRQRPLSPIPPLGFLCMVSSQLQALGCGVLLRRAQLFVLGSQDPNSSLATRAKVKWWEEARVGPQPTPAQGPVSSSPAPVSLQSHLPRTSGVQAQSGISESELQQGGGGQDRCGYGWMGLLGRAV